MSEENPRKYVTVIADSVSDANEYHLEYTEKGYRLHTQNAVSYTVDGVPYREIILTYSLQEDSKYDDIEKYMKVNITDEEQTIPEGWQVIHHTSKELILVKKHE